MEAFTKIINSVKNTIPYINPTEIYNEGWMTRLLVYYTLQEKIKLGEINLWETMNWTSEALISSPFIGKIENKEGYTHADIILGDFDLDYKKTGEIKVKSGYKTFGIIEAKMGSNLSKRTKNAPNYNQASRNLACIAYNTLGKGEKQTFFIVVAPASRLKKYKIEEQVDKATMIEQIKERYKISAMKIDNALIEQATRVTVFTLSYEEWIAKFTNTIIKKELNDFYKECLKWNKVK